MIYYYGPCKLDPIKNELRLNYTSIFSIFNIVNILRFCILAWWWSVWPKPVAKLINKYYNIINCVRLYNCKFVFIYLNSTGRPLKKKILWLCYRRTRNADDYINLLPTLKMAIGKVKACWVNSTWITVNSLKNKLPCTVALDEREIILLYWNVKE